MYLRAGALALSFVIILLPTLGRAADEPSIPVETIIERFVANETEFAKARSEYTYRQTVKMTEYNEGNKPAGTWELIQDIIFQQYHGGAAVL